MRHVRGVKGVTSLITLKPLVAPDKSKRKMEVALRRSIELDASRVTVDANGLEVIVCGTVKSWAECTEAEGAGWADRRSLPMWWTAQMVSAAA